MALSIYLLLTALAGELLRPLLRRFTQPRGAAVAAAGYGTYGVLRGPHVKRVTVPPARLPRSAQGAGL